MSYPTISFVDASGQRLPTDKDGIPFVIQFQARWYIKLNAPWTGSVALKGASYLRLSPVPKSDLWEPPRKLGGDIVRRSGEIIAVLIDEDHRVIQDGPSAVLRTKPANISDQQMDAMIFDIGIMALTTACCVNRSVQIPLGEQAGIESLGRKWVAGSGMLATATALLELADIVKSTWPDIEKRPLKSFIASAGLVEAERAPLTSATLLQKTINPAKKRIRCIMRIESTNCCENEFLCYVLDKYLQNLARDLANSLGALVLENLSDRFVPSLNRRDDSEFRDFAVRSRTNVRLVNEQGRLLKQEIDKAISRLHNCQQWAKQARQSQFLKNVATPQIPIFNSSRLTESFTYGLIYSNFLQVKGDALASIQKVSHLTEAIFQGQVKPTWEIYEIWCLVKLYSGLIAHTALTPSAGAAGLFQSLSIGKDGTISVPKEKTFRLTASANQDIEMSLTYEPRLHNSKGALRTPDFIIETVIEGQRKRYCFDAKYRYYKQQRPDVFEGDVIGTAKEKYKEGLGVSASFILHSDADIDYWGEIPFSHFCRQENIPHTSNNNDWVSHEYGAIALVPNHNDDSQMRKIIRLLLQYHSAQMSTTCITCGYRLTVEKEAFTSWKPDRISEQKLVDRVIQSSDRAGNGTSIYCSCPSCGDFWVIQSCFGPHHRLLKFQNCFHELSSKHGGKWMYVCPACGSDPSPEDLQQAQLKK